MRPNISSHLHMPAQSGSSAVLASMRRGYTREAYDSLIARAREIIPQVNLPPPVGFQVSVAQCLEGRGGDPGIAGVRHPLICTIKLGHTWVDYPPLGTEKVGGAADPQVTLSTDIIVGFCGETEEDHQATLDLMRRTGYDQAFMFAYSRRDKTYAARHLEDDVPEDVKQRRLAEVIAVFREVRIRFQLRDAQRFVRWSLGVNGGYAERLKAPISDWMYYCRA